MSDRERLLAWFASGALMRPDAGVPSTVDLSRALASVCGAPDVTLSAAARSVAESIGPAEHVVFVMADGLGMNLVERLPASELFRERVIAEMQAVFPSSTAPAITSIATGRTPAEHAVPGWFTYLPDDDLISAILPFVERFSKRPLRELGVDPQRAFPVPSWLPTFTHEPRCYMPATITNSIYSNYFGGGTRQEPYNRLEEAVRAIATRIATARQPTYSYLYVPYIDAAEHEHGPYANAVVKAIALVQRDVATLAAAVGGRARIVVSADHGLAEVAPEDQTEIRDGDPLLDLLRLPPSGEPRVPLFYVRDGCDDRFTQAFHERFRWHVLLTIDEVDELRLLGAEPLAAETRRRMGDYMAVSATADTINYKPDAPMLGYHGGLMADEMRIPLIVI